LPRFLIASGAAQRMIRVVKMRLLLFFWPLLLILRASAAWQLSESGTRLSFLPAEGFACSAEDFAKEVAALQENGKLAKVTDLEAGPLLRQEWFCDELLEVMKSRMPKETAALLKSYGNSHNPAMTAFRPYFPDLLLATPSFRKVNAELAKASRTIGQPEFEKLSFEKDGSGKRRFYCMLWVRVLSSELPVDTPLLFRQRDFTCADLAEAVNHFVKLRRVSAEEALKNLIAVAAIRPRGEFDISERAAWICRVLYQPAGETPLRDIRSGGLSLPYRSMPLTKWPLYPLARSGDSLFVLAEGRTLAGVAESLPDYISWCRRNGVWRDKPLPVPDRATALRDAQKLRAGAAWKAIRWQHKSQGSSYNYSEEQEWKWIEQQADRIPETAPPGAGEKQK
jgi:hypothetical protein